MGTNSFQFDPDVVARYEVEGWKAYEDRNWLRLLWLVVALAQVQFRIPFPYSIVAAYYAARASAAWVPKDHDVDTVRGYLARFYRLAQRYSGLTFDPKQAAAEETVYWEAHRRLVGQSDKTDFVEALTALHATIFALTREQARESAALRVEANNVLDTITEHTSDDPPRDWLRCEDLLRRCYRSIDDLRHATT